MSAIGRRWPLLVVPIVIAASALLVVRFGTTHVALQGIEFDVPSGWAVHAELGASLAASQLAIVGTLPWGDCASADLNCHYQERLSRNEIEVDIALGSFRTSDFCDFAAERPDLEPRTDEVRVTESHYLRIAGRPAITTSYTFDSVAYHEADGWREWRIAVADSTDANYRIFAKWRGPDEERLLAEVDRMIASIKLGPSGYAVAGGADCGDPFPPPS